MTRQRPNPERYPSNVHRRVLEPTPFESKLGILQVSYISVISSIPNHCRDHLPISCNQLFFVFVKSRLMGYATVEWYALPVFLLKRRSMIGAPQDCKPRIDFCIVLSDQDHPLWFTVSQSRLVHLVRVQSPSPTAGWNGTGETTMLQTLCFPPQIFNFKKRDRYTIAAKTKVPAHVWWTM